MNNRDALTRSGQSAFRSRIRGERLEEFFHYLQNEEGLTPDSLAFVCIGTDRSTGDALGPLVGTMLTEAGFESVIGTLDQPCDSSNINERLEEIEQGKHVLAIDACLGHPSSVGQFQVSSGPIVPGQSVGKGLPPVGDYGLAAIVGIDGPKPYTVLQTTSLYRVMTMARMIASAAIAVFGPQAVENG